MENGTNMSPSPCRLSTGTPGRPLTRGIWVSRFDSRAGRFSARTLCTPALTLNGLFGLYQVSRFVESWSGFSARVAPGTGGVASVNGKLFQYANAAASPGLGPPERLTAMARNCL